jgi:hypothetical protein
MAIKREIQKIDLTVRDCGTVIRLTPMTNYGQEWIDANVHSEPWQWLGKSLVVDWRFARSLVEGAGEAGLRVLVAPDLAAATN